MAALILLRLMGCFGGEPAFPCCHHEPGRDLYPEVWDEPPTADQVEVVRGAVTRETIDGSVDVRRVAASVAQHARAPAFWEKLRERREAYGTVLAAARGVGGADVLVSGAYAASRLNTDYQSRECRDGPWQLPVHTPGVGPCRWRDGTSWDPRESRELPLDADGFCAIWGCQPDPRRDLAASTRIALKKVPPGGSQREALEALDVGDPAVAVAVHLLAICGLPELFPETAHPHCVEVAVPKS